MKESMAGVSCELAACPFCGEYMWVEKRRDGRFEVQGFHDDMCCLKRVKILANIRETLVYEWNRRK